MAVAALVPMEEYLSSSWEPDREYVDGRLIERNVGELDHSYLQYRIAKLLEQRGLLPFVELRVQVTPTRFRIPDVLAVRGARPSGRFLRRPPYVAVEVLSREDRAPELDDKELDDKIEDYLNFGAGNVWVVDPRRLRVTVHARNGNRICEERAESSDGAISIPVSEIFADMPSTEEE